MERWRGAKNNMEKQSKFIISLKLGLQLIAGILCILAIRFNNIPAAIFGAVLYYHSIKD